MTYDKLMEAVMMAFYYHKGQKRADGSDYILHPLTVMTSLPTALPIETKIVAVLHDILEDTNIPPSVIESRLGKDILNKIEILSHDDGDYEDYIDRISKDEVATEVKIADLRHNLSTIDNIKDTIKQNYLRLRYNNALATLTHQ